jgi:tetratricopeptide (TPR) repeat protein
VLLDRKRVKFWQKWVFAIMAIIMAGFLVMIPLGSLKACGGSTTSAVEQIDKEIAKYKTQTAADPTNVDAWLGLAENYVLRANQQVEASTAQKTDWLLATQSYQAAIKLLKTQKGDPAARQKRLDTLDQLASVYISLTDYQSAVGVYQQITSLRPKDPQSYFDLATVAINAGDKNTALLAFTKFLELDPTSPDAKAVQDWIDSATASPTPSPSASGSPVPSATATGAAP